MVAVSNVKISLLVCIFIVTSAYGKSSRKQDSEYRLKKFSAEDFNLLDHKTSIEDFSNNGLCRHLQGQQYLQTAMKSKLPDIKDSTLSMFTSQLCAEGGILLEMWVGELFDSDGDGSLNHFEMNYYKSNK